MIQSTEDVPETEFGGNIVKNIVPKPYTWYLLGQDPYEYVLLHDIANDEIKLTDLRSFTLLYLSGSVSATVKIGSHFGNQELKIGDVAQVEGMEVSLSITNGTASFLMAGVKNSFSVSQGISVTRAKDIYRVEKPWGHELWLNGEHPLYALKQISIKAGNKTSLQYHRRKRETLILLEGRALLHFKQVAEIGNDVVDKSHIGQTHIEALCTLDTHPKTLHRLEAVTNLLLYETSTPDLDDVVRVFDDSNRPDGRLSAEHKK